MMQVTGLSKSFGKEKVLRGITFDASPGEIIAVVGSNGAGKTTLLRCLAGALLPTSGRITYDGVALYRSGHFCHTIPPVRLEYGMGRSRVLRR